MMPYTIRRKRGYNFKFEILWCEYLWVATSPGGGFGGPPPRKFRNMKCSRSDSRPILGIGFVNGGSKFYGVNIYVYQSLLAGGGGGGLGVLPQENLEI